MFGAERRVGVCRGSFVRELSVWFGLELSISSSRFGSSRFLYRAALEIDLDEQNLSLRGGLEVKGVA